LFSSELDALAIRQHPHHHGPIWTREFSMSSSQKPAASPVVTSRLSRRSLVTGAAAAIGAVGIASSVVLGQNTDKKPQTGTDPATPNVLSSTPVPAEVTEFAGDWPVVQGNLKGTRAAADSPINSGNIGQLATAWSLPITTSGTASAITATPVIIDQVVYIQDMQSNVYAIDFATGEQIWRTDYNVPSNGPNGVAVAYGMVYAATGDTSVMFALDAKTGQQVWENDLSNNNYECIDMAPVVYDNVVYISTNPNNTTYGNYRGGARGILFALDAAGGSTLWSFDTSTDNLWGSPRINSGAGLWYPPSIDDDGNLYMGTGNAAPYPGNTQYPSGSSRPGANDYATSMVSLDLTTGAIRWSLNAKPHDLFDFDFQNTPVLATVMLNETPTLVAIGSGKTGTVISANAATGALLWKTPVGEHQNDELETLPPGSTEVKTGQIQSPGAFGDGKYFAPYRNRRNYFTPNDADQEATPQTTAEETGGLAAVDAVTGKVAWDVAINSVVVAGATVVNDVVLTGSLDGYVRGFDVKTGNKVWEFLAPAGLNAPYAVAGDTIVIAATAPYIAYEGDGATPVTDPAAPVPQIIALKLGS
jgi:alcohol dehydrogenase (cytochrome c)